MFTPKSPETKANLKYVREQCAKLNVDKLIENAIAEKKIVFVNDQIIV
jgi:hypothetical protein